MLTESIIQKAKPKVKQYKLSDGKGLHLLVYPTGGKCWRYRYSFQGKESMVSLGSYPEISLQEARRRLMAARTDKAMGVNPRQKKQITRRELIASQENTFEKIAWEWHGKEKDGWDAKYAKEVLRRLEFNLFPYLGSRPIGEITALEFLEILRKIEARGVSHPAKRCCQMASKIFRYAVITGRAEYDAAAAIKDALKVPPPAKSHHHIEPHGLPEFMASLKQYGGRPLTKLALHFLLLTFVRTNELREARWEEIHWEAKLWKIPAERMKMKRMHLVPLSRQAIDILTRIQKISGHTLFLFPGTNSPKSIMGANTILSALTRMGYQHKATGHGFRSTASTALREMGFRREHIEMQLAHAPNKIYDHAKYLPQREEMMQHWSDFLDAMGEEGSKATTKDFRVDIYPQE